MSSGSQAGGRERRQLRQGWRGGGCQERRRRAKLTQRLLLEVGALQAVSSRGSGKRRRVTGRLPPEQRPSQGASWGGGLKRPTHRIQQPGPPSLCALLPFLGVKHEEEVEEAKAGLRQPGELVLQVVVGLLAQGVLAHQRQLGEALEAERSAQ